MPQQLHEPPTPPLRQLRALALDATTSRGPNDGCPASGPKVRPRSARAERVLHAALALTAMIAASPLLLLIAVVVRLSSPGPILYTQTRIGIDRRRRGSRSDAETGKRRRDLGGRPFTTYKFRTMYDGSEHASGEVWATRDDPRVTPVGRMLRRARLDELPQLWNVLRGEMNVVGPRPERPGIFVQLREHIPRYADRQRARPGITGLAQISRGYDTCLEDVRDKLEWDLAYIARQGVREDFRILLRTVPVLLLRRGGW